jgi:ryanodine receptor 2
VNLPSELNSLVEKMAENVHDEWAKTRIEQGWSYGDTRDDKNKKHPCLVPYDELPEEEKAYDRNSAISTLKFIIFMGFSITKN